MNRWDVVDAVVLSGRQCLDAPDPTEADPFPVCSRHALTATQRNVMHCLVRRASADTAVIPRWRQPSIPELCADAGLKKTAVMDALDALVKSGWLVRDRPSRRAPYVYGFAIPSEPTGGPLSSPADEPLAETPDPSDPADGPLSSPADDPSGPADDPESSASRTTMCSSVSEVSPGGLSRARADGSPTTDDPDPAAPDIAHPRDPAYEHVCPHCAQAPGRPCREYVRRQGHTGAPLGEPHAARRDLARHDERQDEAS